MRTRKYYWNQQWYSPYMLQEQRQMYVDRIKGIDMVWEKIESDKKIDDAESEKLIHDIMLPAKRSVTERYGLFRKLVSLHRDLVDIYADRRKDDVMAVKIQQGGLQLPIRFEMALKHLADSVDPYVHHPTDPFFGYRRYYFRGIPKKKKPIKPKPFHTFK